MIITLLSKEKLETWKREAGLMLADLGKNPKDISRFVLEYHAKLWSSRIIIMADKILQND